MNINELIEITMLSLDENELLECDAINNFLAGCGITSGRGSCGALPY